MWRVCCGFTILTKLWVAHCSLSNSSMSNFIKIRSPWFSEITPIWQRFPYGSYSSVDEESSLLRGCYTVKRSIRQNTILPFEMAAALYLLTWWNVPEDLNFSSSHVAPRPCGNFSTSAAWRVTYTVSHSLEYALEGHGYYWIVLEAK